MRSWRPPGHPPSRRRGRRCQLRSRKAARSPRGSAVWRFSATSTGSKTIQFRAWSENGGTDNESVVINPVLAQPDLVVDTVFVDKSTLAPSESFTLSATTRNQGTGSSPSSTLRYLLSGDSTIDTGDTLMSTDGISPLAPGGTDPDSDLETAPSTPGTYWVGGCADAVAGELSTTNNCSVGVQIVVQTCSAPETLTISNYTVSTVELFEACLWIFLGPDFTVEGPGGQATFKSESLRVGNGFKVLAGGTATFDNDPPL